MRTLIPAFAILIMQHGVAVKESATPGILPRQTYRIALMQQRRVSQGLGHAPVEQQLAFGHQPPILHDFFHARMQLKILRYFANLARQHLHGFHRQTRIVVFIPLRAFVRRPIGLERRLVVGEYGLIGVIATIQRVTASRHCGIGIPFADHAVARQPVCIHLARRRMRVNAFVHQGLRHHRLVLLVVTEPAVTHHIDHRILVEFHAVIERDFRHKTHRFRIIAVDMEDRHFKHLRDIRAIHRRT